MKKLILILIAVSSFAAHAFVSLANSSEAIKPTLTRAEVCMFNSSHHHLNLTDAKAKCQSDEGEVIKARANIESDGKVYGSMNECMFYVGLDHDDMIKVSKICKWILGVSYHPKTSADVIRPSQIRFDTNEVGAAQ